MNTTQIKILLVDDDAIVRKGLLSLLDDASNLKVVAEAEDGSFAIDLTRQLTPDLVVMDISLPGIDGIETTRQILNEFPATKIIGWSSHHDIETVQAMLQAGASGYILKGAAPEEVLRGLRSVIHGDSYLSPSITSNVISRFLEVLTDEQTNAKGIAKGTDDIVFTALQQPQLPANYVLRQRLLQKLNDHRHLPLQFIIAPAGYGKSTLVSAWLKQQNWPTSWLNINKNDNDLSRFLSYFIHAVHCIFPGVLSAMDKLLKSGNLPPIHMLAQKLINSIEQVEQDFIVVLDELHLVKEKSVHDLLSEMLSRPPGHMHLVIITRMQLLLPIVSLRVREKVNEIRLGDLKFTPLETREFLQKKVAKEFDASTVDYWTEKAEGWPSALQLAALSISHQDESVTRVDKKQIESQYVKEYLFSETLAHLQPEICQWLICSSIFERFCGPLCDAVCQPDQLQAAKQSNSWDIIRQLQHNNIFLIELDENKFWFRHHSLFQQLLHKQLAKKYSAEKIAKLHSRAGDWFEGQGLITDAIRHAIKAGKPEAAAEMVERHRWQQQEHGSWQTIDNWLAMLPVDIKAQRPGLQLARAWISHELFRPDCIAAIIERLKSMADQQPLDENSLTELSLLQAILQYWQGQGELSLKSLRLVREQSSYKHPRLSGIIESYFALANQMTGQGEPALQILNDRLQDDYHQSSKLVLHQVLARAFLQMLNGKLLPAGEDALTLKSNRQGMSYIKGWGYYIRALGHFRCNNLEAALACFTEVIVHCDLFNARAVMDAMVGLALTYQALEQESSATRIVEQMMAYAHELNVPQLLQLAYSGRARIALAQDNLDAALPWLWSQEEPVPTPSLFIWLEMPVVTRARLLSAMATTASLKKACDLLEAQLQTLQAQHNNYQKIVIMPLLALVYKQQDREAEALSVLSSVLQLARTGGWVQPFVELGPEMAELLKKLVSENTETSYIKKILSSFIVKEQLHPATEASIARQPSDSLVEKLTSREMEILQLLSKRLSNQEISDKLCISTETVKYHLKNIYTKFAVNKRKEAVIKAKNLGVLEPLL